MLLKKNIYISGFMGTGKTTVGKLLANRLDVLFIDTDQFIEQNLKMSIAQIFKKKGESFFRQQERLLLLRLSCLTSSVIGLGGGMVLDYSNRIILNEGIWINLKASSAAIMKRIAGQKTRPLLGKKVKREEVEKILQQRRPYYDLAPCQIETDGFTPDTVAGLIVNCLETVPFLRYTTL